MQYFPNLLGRGTLFSEYLVGLIFYGILLGNPGSNPTSHF